MKIKSEHYTALKIAIQPFDTEVNRPVYREGKYPRPERTLDVDKRYRWDLVWATKVDLSPFYGYLNDEHIDTALRGIVGPLGGCHE